jgi:thiol-disulfide isomerase/thioredoxin
MRLATISILLTSLLALGQTPEPARDRYELLLKQYGSAKEALAKASKEAGDKQAPEKLKLVQERESQLSAFAGRFLTLASEHPDEPVAFDALATVVSERITLDDEVAAVGLLVKHHVRDKRLAPLCTTRLRYLSRSPSWPEAESCLRELIEKSPHPEVKANACFSLAILIEDKAKFARYLGRKPGGGSNQVFFKAMLGEGGLKRLQGSDPERLDDEAAHLYRRIIEQYPDASDASGNLAKQAGGRMFAIRNLGIGKVAPDIVSQDLDGKPMKLSDFRGKVVVLNFWATWCGPCMALVPQERALVGRLKGRPFALVGFDGDEDKAAAKVVAEKEGMTWRSFWDGGRNESPVVAKWGISSWPTIYVIDHHGIIRFQNVDFPNEERFEEVVDHLLRELEGKP